MRLILALFLICTVIPACAQHEHMMPSMPAHPTLIPASRHGSGTSWMPDTTPMYGMSHRVSQWELMYHGMASLAYDEMNGPRGDSKLISTNWAMLDAQRPVGERDMWRLSGMVSLEPASVGGSGYPLLFQSGETWRDQPLKDHQHPHNYISELSAEYTHAFSPDSTGFIYLAPVGEPALGPPAYIHRTHGLDNPLAPIGHHWQDSSHITYGVATLGYQTRRWQMEVSSFNGREPGENRLEIEAPRFDSFSGRLSVNPNENLAAQVSYGLLNSVEALHPDVDVHRTTASVIYNHPLGERSNFQAALVWGRNTAERRDLDSFLLEAQWKHDGGWTPYLRLEQVRKDAEELVLPRSSDPDRVFTLRQASLGIVRDLPVHGDFLWGIGAEILLNDVPSDLKPVYGDNPTGWLIYLRVHPQRHSH